MLQLYMFLWISEIGWDKVNQETLKLWVNLEVEYAPYVGQL